MARRTATSLLLTRCHSEAREVFLVERAPELRFFGGYWAFPGGVLDEGDWHSPDEDEAWALRRCGLRELFEETGLLLGSIGSGWSEEVRHGLRQDLSARRPSAEAKATWQRAIATASADELEIVRPLCSMTTPPFAPVRYATQFLQVEVPEEARLEVWEGELVRGEFVRPAEALRSWRAGERLIAPPVLFLLELLESCEESKFAATVERETRAMAAGRLHPVRFVPGIFMAPLATPTLPPATTTNCFLIGDERQCVVDPATYEVGEQERLFEKMDAEIARGARFESVLVTHHHPDHVGAVAAVSRRYSLPVLAHPLTLERLPEPVATMRPIEDGAVLDLGKAPDGSPDWKLKAIHTPGHDRGHLCFVESRYRAAVVGDMMSTVSTIVIDPPEGHLATYLGSLSRLLEEPLGVVHPAHGPAHRDGHELIRTYLAHRAEREASLLAALGTEPRSIASLVSDVYTDIDPRLYALAGRSLLAGLHKLRDEGLANEQAESWSRTRA